MIDNHPLLSLSIDEIVGLSQEERKSRLDLLLQQSWNIIDEGVDTMVSADNRKVAAFCSLYSGGNDSTILTHLFRHLTDYAVHINTGIGIEQTREFVRETCEKWGLPLIEEHPPPGSTYEELVMDRGFPGPGMHWKMYQRLKERGLHAVRRRIVKNPWKERVIYLAGRRREESKRRMNIGYMDRMGSMVFISPLVNWTKLDLNTYREHNEVPSNPVSDALHMSGECLCGAFAHEGELDEIGFWYPEVRSYIEDLQERVKAAGHSEPVCRWGWGQNSAPDGEVKESGVLCTSCDSRFAKEGLIDTEL